ncbi:non-specific serine/threonine protein kinase [Ranunculus cassubicifolius]
MAKSWIWISLTFYLFFEILISSTLAATDHLDVEAINDLYENFGYPSQLTGWKSEGGDPCEESWKGVSCNGTSIILIELTGLGLSGHLGGSLYLQNLKHLDLSSNYIRGEIPNYLPLNLTHLDLSCNNFSMNIPYSLAFVKHLHHLNLSHNFLSGPVGNLFTAMQNLRRMDLSYNSLAGDLPSSFANLTNLTDLYLQENKFTGSVIFLAHLHLTNLNIENNNFSGVLPKQFQNVPNLWIGGNRFQFGSGYPAWDFPQDRIPIDQNISSPPATESNAIENYPSHSLGKKKEKRRSPVGVVSAVAGVALVATCAALFMVIRIKRRRVYNSQDLDDEDESLPISTNNGCACATSEELALTLPNKSSPALFMRHIPSIRPGTAENMEIRSFPRKSRNPVTAKSYTVAELQIATNTFNEENLLGEGSLGSVFRAEFPDGEVLAVKNISTVALSVHEEEQFLDVVSNVARLRHPNIVTLVGYCMEHDQHLLVYEYIRSLTLEDVLHYNGNTHLNWVVRMQIALSIARALDYLHSACLPPVAHCNLKSANILLDDEFMPRLCDCGLAVLRPLTSNRIKLKASELAINCTGYSAPENSQPGTDKLKSDIYAFGVLLLELVTGRKPFDSSRPMGEQSLVKWASPRLHDYNALVAMIDPTTRRTFSPRLLSRFAYIISLCIQTEPEFRPPMSDIVFSLEILNGRSSADGLEATGDPCDMSFHSTATGLICSPVTSTASV